LDTKNQKLGKNRNSSVLNLLQIQGTSNPPTNGRVQPAWPSLTTGIDYAGPVSLQLGSPRSKTVTKCYIAIFVCFVTKAIHIEVVTSLTTEAFIAALRRFIARIGKPRTISSDNGTNVHGAANQLH
jgi:hypothetical protein